MPAPVSGKSRIVATVTGIVQGVGFRPFVYRLARDLELSGQVINTQSGVEIDVEGPPEALEALVASISGQAPPLATIESISTRPMPAAGFASFSISASDSGSGGWQPVSADACTCDACLEELYDPGNRRYRYPFINCTSCGPRFTIINGLPYDRALTTMKHFVMCEACQAEYDDPRDRRFHAEPNACPQCGPSLELVTAAGGGVYCGDPIEASAHALLEGAIVAIKGIGGFQLACLADNAAAVARLRLRKRRSDKPFAVMVASTADAGARCLVSPTERRLLESPARPVVLLRRQAGADIDGGVAPRLSTLGVMLPSSPLHFLLIDAVGRPLVMTSGNLSEEPICRSNDEARLRLGPIADFLLLHDREIVSAYDDSVVAEDRGRPVFIRRARGYAPVPVPLPRLSKRDLFAAGAELKNTFCLVKGDRAIVSQHNGDLGNAETLSHFESTVALYERLFAARPALFARDKHPDFLASIYARERAADVDCRALQHHRAHAASCLAENGIEDRSIAVAFDGSGYGDDGVIWGGEFFNGSLSSGLKRAAHLEYFGLPGGDAAVREPWRTALSVVHRWCPDKLEYAARRLDVSSTEKEILAKQLESGLNTPLTSSCGRLFDAAAAIILGLREVSYEAQAAAELEALASQTTAASSDDACFLVNKFSFPWTISPANMLKAVIAHLEAGGEAAGAAYMFHDGVAAMVAAVAAELAAVAGTDKIALSGGVFQNRLLLSLIAPRLQDLSLFTQVQLPPNDGGLSYGQAALVLYQAEA